MRTIILLLAVTILGTHQLLAQNTSIVTGIFLDDHNKKPLSGVTVFLHPINQRIQTDQNGYFQFTSIPFGHYKIRITFFSVKGSHSRTTG